MQQQNQFIRKTAFAGLVAAMYIALVTVTIPTSFGLLQFRAAEALTLLPFIFPAAIPGLFAGCFLSNLLFGGLGPVDWIFGSLATLSAALLTSRIKNRWLAAVPPVAINALVVGAYLSLMFENAAYIPFGVLTVGIGQVTVCFGLGVPLTYALEKAGLAEKLSLGRAK
ncbi:MAG: QueT transporter family protein [Oscillospiraceae bacterium]|nr:QueT transporter family protein [Oscillospiraceae bacterium]